ncbi:sensor histidine kinase KdpD [Gammaproteobacteria bacterium]
MNDSSIDPDELLLKLSEEEANAARGKLKIFFGASAGVGKTYAMLAAAQKLSKQKKDVVIGIVETHGREETEEMLIGIERLPLKEIPYRGQVFQEFDLGSAIDRMPDIILVDELAHSNVNGSRHPKRWQDVEELLEAGINVYTTVNVQHLETLNDAVSGITGIRVFETIPDQFFKSADEVFLVDLPPEELLQRLEQGKVYYAPQAERAAKNFFRKGNLIALRELALRCTADSVDEQMIEYRQNCAVPAVWQTRESLLACLSPHEADRIVRASARIAGYAKRAARVESHTEVHVKVPWHVIYVETPELQRLPDSARHRILSALKLAQDMGAITTSLIGEDAAEETVKYARKYNLSRVIIGQGPRKPFYLKPFACQQSFAEQIKDIASDLDIIQAAYTQVIKPESTRRFTNGEGGLLALWPKYAQAVLLFGITTLLTLSLPGLFEIINIVLLLLLTVVITAARYGQGPALLVSFLSMAIFNLHHPHDIFFFEMQNLQHLLTFGIILAIGLITGQLTDRFRYQVQVATSREDRMRALYEMSRDLSAAITPSQIMEICAKFILVQFKGRSALILTDDEDCLQPPIAGAAGMPDVDMGVVQWAFRNDEDAGAGTDTLPGSALLYLPLKAPVKTRGVLAIELLPKLSKKSSDKVSLMVPEQIRLLDTFARLIAIAIERLHYVRIAQTTEVQIESERSRRKILTGISQDLRAPVSSLLELAESLGENGAFSGEQNVILISMYKEARRMSALLDNLLESRN